MEQPVAFLFEGAEVLAPISINLAEMVNARPCKEDPANGKCDNSNGCDFCPRSSH